MNIFIYDKTFEGLLSAVFYAYDTKIFPDKITCLENYQETLFAEKYHIYTNEEYARRVWTGVEKKTSKLICRKIHRVFLSEMEDMEMVIFRYIQAIFNANCSVDTDYGNPVVLEFNNIYKSVSMEAHRAIMFLRFQKTKDGIYYAPFDPEYDVLPLTINHFQDRFSDQQWIVYDTRRNYGFYFNLNTVEEITISESTINPLNGKLSHEVMAEDELQFQELWNDYYKHTTIKERKNLKVHRQFMPKRFWKYLPEKNFVKQEALT